MASTRRGLAAPARLILAASALLALQAVGSPAGALPTSTQAAPAGAPAIAPPSQPAPLATHAGTPAARSVHPATEDGAAASAAAQCSATPFTSSPSKRRWYRIPALVRTDTGTLLAFAERRDNSNGTDLGNYDIVTARSTDRGCSWSSPVVIADDAANRVSNPVPIVDRTTGTVLLFSVVTVRPGSGGSGKGLYLQTSSDDGQTFTPLLQHPVRPEGSYKGGLTGPGHGLQLSITHAGRLILPLGYKTAAGRYGAYGIYSDDHGTTWHTGFDQQDTTGQVQFLEGTLAELPTGKLFISFRDKHPGARTGTARQYAFSSDGGATLAGPFVRRPLKIVSVQGSALALTGPHRDLLLFSAPADPTVTLRRDLTVFASTTSGATWNKGYQVELESTPGAYSDLVQLDDATIGILYETGSKTWKERIAYRSIPIAQLTRPTLATARLTYSRSARPTATTAKAKILTTVTVKGIASPPGRVTLTYSRKGTTGRKSVDLTYSNRGVRAITLPKLKKGKYALRLTYSGTGRIAKASRSAGTLHVVTP